MFTCAYNISIIFHSFLYTWIPIWYQFPQSEDIPLALSCTVANSSGNKFSQPPFNWKCIIFLSFSKDIFAGSKILGETSTYRHGDVIWSRITSCCQLESGKIIENNYFQIVGNRKTDLWSLRKEIKWGESYHGPDLWLEIIPRFWHKEGKCKKGPTVSLNWGESLETSAARIFRNQNKEIHREWVLSICMGSPSSKVQTPSSFWFWLPLNSLVSNVFPRILSLLSAGGWVWYSRTPMIFFHLLIEARTAMSFTYVLEIFCINVTYHISFFSEPA